MFRKSDVEDVNTQTPAIENIRGTQSLCDTSSFMERSKNFFELVEKPDGKVYWKGALIKTVGENRISIQDVEYDRKSSYSKLFFCNTKLTTKDLDTDDKKTIYNIPDNNGF